MKGKAAMLGAVLAWGGWGIASRQAVVHAHPYTVQWLMAIPQILLLPAWFFMAKDVVTEVRPSLSTIAWAFGSCVLTVGANLLYSIAMKTEQPSTVIAVTSAYPIVTLLFLVLMGIETFSWAQMGGCVLIAAGVILLQSHPSSIPKKEKTIPPSERRETRHELR